MGVVLNIIPPRARPDQYKTYGWQAPLSTHWRRATCAEFDCDAYRNGWQSTADVGTDLGQRQAEYMRHDRTRSFTIERVGGTLVRFTYPPGNTCFRADEHRVPNGRPALFTLRRMHWTAPGPAGGHLFRGPQDWVDDFAEHQDRIATAIKRG